MKKIILALLLLTSLSAIKANAQMEAAQKIKWDVEKSVDINMPLEMTWGVFSNNDLLKKASNGYVSAIEVLDSTPPVSRKIVFSNGSSRVENITQNEPHNKLIAIDFADTNLPKGIKSAEFAIFLKDKDGKTNVTWRGMVKGDGEAKKALVTQLTAEFDSYAAGLDKMTKKSIPATKMN
ncbi:SRPBCC family protein [Pedobacter nutrimenti]|uniref:SRPBCC family protein n=1 Tax=Pedobacter nutrimenti TaxID=1241337 RepID=UPI00292E6BAE|nr:SRPBCC family protein [Pedobacter nutrimenti]